MTSTQVAYIFAHPLSLYHNHKTDDYVLMSSVGESSLYKHYICMPLLEGLDSKRHRDRE